MAKLLAEVALVLLDVGALSRKVAWVRSMLALKDVEKVILTYLSRGT